MENTYKLICGDCLELMKTIPDASVDMILCDLPYGTTACEWDTVIPFGALWNCYKRIIKPHGAIVLFGVEPFSSNLRLSNLSMFKYDLIWNKDLCKNPGLAKIRPLPSFEVISVFGDGRITYNPQMEQGEPYVDIRNKPTRILNGNQHKYGFTGNTVNVVNDGTRYPKSVITFRNPNQKGQHPTQKPVALLEYLIKTYTNENETILDNCMGSGSTGVAAINTNRNFIGIELEEKYFEVAKSRIDAAKHQMAWTPNKVSQHNPSNFILKKLVNEVEE